MHSEALYWPTYKYMTISCLCPCLRHIFDDMYLLINATPSLVIEITPCSILSSSTISERTLCDCGGGFLAVFDSNARGSSWRNLPWWFHSKSGHEGVFHTQVFFRSSCRLCTGNTSENGLMIYNSLLLSYEGTRRARLSRRSAQNGQMLPPPRKVKIFKAPKTHALKLGNLQQKLLLR